MAYPFYQTPYQQYYPVTYQPMQMQTQQAFPSSQQSFSSSGIIWVDDEREAAMYPIAPNTAVALWDKSGKRAYMKKSDATGKPTMTVYDLVERPENASVESASTSEEYVKKSDLVTVVEAVKGIDSLIGSIKADIETMKGDLYGAVGRKRVKKQESEDDE